MVGSQRAFMLPEPIDVDSVSADLKDGLLTVTLPKAGRPRQPRRRSIVDMIRKILLTFVLVVAGFVGRAGRHRPHAHRRRLPRRARRAAPEPQTPAPQADARHHRPPRRRCTASRLRTSRESPARPSKASRTSRRCRSCVARTRRSETTRSSSTFFGDQDMFGSRDRRSLSLGSGVIVSADGYIVTNNHVVGENVREITVALRTSAKCKGRVIGTDPATDIALLKVDAKGLPALPWG